MGNLRKCISSRRRTYRFYTLFGQLRDRKNQISYKEARRIRINGVEEDTVFTNGKRNRILQLTCLIIFHLLVLLGFGHVKDCKPVGANSVRSGKKGVRLIRKEKVLRCQ